MRKLVAVGSEGGERVAMELQTAQYDRMCEYYRTYVNLHDRMRVVYWFNPP